jgi:hypothetical protein
VFAPPSINGPAPNFVNETAPPPTTPKSATSINVVNVVFEVSVPGPEKVNFPVFTASPKVTAPPMEYALANVRAVSPSLETVDPAIAKLPVPNAASFPT